MPTYEVTSPDGKVWEVTAPDGASQDQIIDFAKKQWSASSGKQQDSEQEPLGQYLRRLVGNIPSSAASFGKDMLGAVTNPVRTATTAADALAGGLRALTPGPVQRFIDKADDPETTQRIDSTANAIGNLYAGRYGSLDKAKETLATDPVGATADLSTLFGAGSMVAPGRVSSALGAASRATNPLSAVAPVARLGGSAVSNALGLTTGAGTEAVKQAFSAGKTGAKSFVENMRGRVPITDVLDDAKTAVQNMGAAKNQQYQAGMAGIKSDAAVLKFDGIDRALSSAAGRASFKGVVKNERAADVVSRMGAAVDEWKALPADEFHTPAGLDALKQKLGGIMESIPFEEKTARLAAGEVYNSVKSEISKQAPTYAKVMREYSDASETIREVERALSLGQRSAADTGVRKLQSLMRNNVQTNYGNRLDMAKKLAEDGGVDIMPAVAGQALNDLVPRGLARLGGTAMLSGPLYGQPLSLLGLPFQSPRLVGEGAYLLGSAGRGAGRLGLTPGRTTGAGLLGGMLGRVDEENER